MSLANPSHKNKLNKTNLSKIALKRHWKFIRGLNQQVLNIQEKLLTLKKNSGSPQLLAISAGAIPSPHPYQLYSEEVTGRVGKF